MSDYDVAILGAGPGGYVAALRAAMRGARVCCIEAGRLGGTCLNVGCIPTKAMLHAAELHYEANRAGQLGLNVDVAAADGPAFMARTGEVVAALRTGVAQLLKARKVDVVAGRGRLLASDRLSVVTADGPREIAAESIIIATGSRPVRPGFLPWDSPRVMTTDEATTAESLPQSVLIVGGGVIGCEFATITSELGIRTTVVEMLDALAGGAEPDVSKAVARSLKRRRVTIHTGTEITSVTISDDGVMAELANGKTVPAAAVLSAVGRAPNIEEIGLEALGIELADGVIRVDQRCRTSVANVYAVGDAASRRQYAHLASRMGVVAADNATGHPAADPLDVVPACIYTHPEVASVGLTEAEARQGSRDVRVAEFPYRAVGIARAYGQVDGRVKLVADAGGRLLGGSVICARATDVIGLIALAVRKGLSIQDLAETIHAHPTFAEAVGEAAEAWAGMPIHFLERR